MLYYNVCKVCDVSVPPPHQSEGATGKVLPRLAGATTERAEPKLKFIIAESHPLYIVRAGQIHININNMELAVWTI